MLALKLNFKFRFKFIIILFIISILLIPYVFSQNQKQNEQFSFISLNGKFWNSLPSDSKLAYIIGVLSSNEVISIVLESLSSNIESLYNSPNYREGREYFKYFINLLNFSKNKFFVNYSPFEVIVYLDIYYSNKNNEKKEITGVIYEYLWGSGKK